MSSPKMTTSIIGWILIIISILPASLGQCPVGWDGLSCRRRNVALNRPTSQSSNWNNTLYHSGNAVDGKTGHNVYSTPCTHTDNGPGQSWTVTLDKSYWIYKFAIYNRNEDCIEGQCGARLNGFTVSVGTSSGAYTTCYEDTTNTPEGPGDVITQHCTSPVEGNMVKISLSSASALSLCEVLLYMCADGWYGEMCNTPCRTPSTCRRCDPTGTRCEACVDGWYGEACNRPCVTTTACRRCDSTGTRCQECVSGRYGEHCLSRCGNCYDNRGCNKQTGHCPEIGGTRCEAGYRGLFCLNPCTGGRYGPDCGESCGFCTKGNASCDRTSGHCPTEPDQPVCMPGFTGLDCKSPCDSGKWGDNCVNTCSENCISPTCKVATGVCEGGCHPGYTGERCDTDCPTGSWGDNCVSTCSENCLEQPCNPQTGACEGGCQPGYAGKFCETEFSVTNFVDYTSVIVGCVIGVILTALLITAVVLYVRRRQSGESEGTVVSVENTVIAQGVPHPEPPSRAQGPGTDPVTYYNITAEEENPYEAVTEKEYDKVRFSRLDTEKDYTCLT